jgi:hypothetical protein
MFIQAAEVMVFLTGADSYTRRRGPTRSGPKKTYGRSRRL